MAKGAIKINAKIWSGRLDAKIREMEKLTGKKRAEIVKSSMDHFLRSAGKATPQTKPKKRTVEQAKDKRDWVLFATPQTRVNPADSKRFLYKARSFKAFFFGKKSEANKYKKIKNRGIGKMGWWASLMRLGFNSTTPRGYVQDISDKARKYSSLSSSFNLAGRAMSTARNSIDRISRYGEIAKNMALRSTAKWMNANVNRIKKDMQSKFNK